MIIDCGDCALQHTVACDDCVVTHLLDLTGPTLDGPIEVDDSEATALGHLADAGLVAPLRLVSRRDDSQAAAG